MKNSVSQPEPCDICGKQIVWTSSNEAKNANDPTGPTHCCAASAYDKSRKS